MASLAKRVSKDKKQIARELDVARQQKLVQEKLYPALVGATTSIDEAKMLTQAISSLIMEESMKVLKEKTIGDIKESLVKKLTEDGRKEEITALLDTVDGETLFTVRMLIEGMKSAIDQTVNDEMRNRTLKSLELDWNRIMQKIG